MHRINKLFLSMLLTYFLQKFRKTAPVLVVLQLLAFCTFLVYQKYSEPKPPDLEEYIWVLQQNNMREWNELEFEVKHFEYQILKERRGESFMKMANFFFSIAEKYQKKVMHLQRQIKNVEVTNSNNKEENILKSAKNNNWQKQISELLVDFQKEMKVVAELEGLHEGYAWEELVERGYHKLNKATETPYNQIFENLKELDLALEMAYTTILNYAREHISLVFGRVAMCGNIKYNRYRVEVIPNSKKIYEGDMFEAEIVLVEEAEFIPQYVVVEDDTLKQNRNNRATYGIRNPKIGTHWLSGEVHTKDERGWEETYPFIHEYTVLPKCN